MGKGSANEIVHLMQFLPDVGLGTSPIWYTP
jgi:hypothetical protein